MNDVPMKEPGSASRLDESAGTTRTTTQTDQNGESDMSGLIRMSFDSPEEIREFEGDSGQLELVNLDAGPVVDWQGFADRPTPL